MRPRVSGRRRLPAWGFALVLAAAWLVVRPHPVDADASITVDAGALVTKVTGEGKMLRAVISKGKLAGVKVGTIVELFPMTPSDDGKYTSAKFDVRLARGKVIEVTDTSATLALEAIADAVTPGAYVTYPITVSKELARSPLFRVTALGVELAAQYEDKVHVTLEELLADPSQARRDKAIDAMIADVKAMKEIVVDALKNPIQEGAYHGRTAGQVVDAMDRGQVEMFLTFVEAYPGKYLGHRWKLPEIYFTWVINGTPSGDRERKLREVRPTVAAAWDAITAGKLDEARVQWLAVLRVVPDHEDATDSLKAIDKILRLTGQVATDPDDTATMYTLADALYDLGAYDLALKYVATLAKKKYDPFKLECMRGYLFTRKKKWAEAAALFTKLAKERPKDSNLASWAWYSRAQGMVAKSPNDPAGHLEAARQHEDRKRWDRALGEYRKVLELERATDKQREEAKAAQQRLAIRKDLEFRLTSVRDYIKSHQVKSARERIPQVLQLLDKLGDSGRTGEVIDELADLARGSNEEELALELHRKGVELVPDSMSAHTSLAWGYLVFDRLDEAGAEATKALELKGDPSTANLYLSYVARGRGDFAGLEKHAAIAAKDPKYPWPLLGLARVEAARGNWQAAAAHARKALEMRPGEWDMRATHVATLRGLQAHEALQADPSSPRERLRLVRALGHLGISHRIAEEINKLPLDGAWRSEGWWSLAVSPDNRVLLADRLTAARNAKLTIAYRKRQLEQLELRAKLRANPKDDATRIALGRSYIKGADFDSGLAVLGPLIFAFNDTGGVMRPEVGDLVRDAREAIAVSGKIDEARAALGRQDYDGALRIAAEYQVVQDRIGTFYGRLAARDFRGEVLSAQGKYAEAIVPAQESRALCVSDGEPRNVMVADRIIAGLRSSIGTNDELRKGLEASRKLAEDDDEEFDLFFVQMQLTSLAIDDGRMPQAIEHARKAWNLADRLGRPDFARNARLSLADSNLVANRISDAEQLALKLLVDSRQYDDTRNEQLSLMILGAVAMMRAQGPQARVRFQEVYDLGTRTGETGMRALARHFEGKAWLQADHAPAKALPALEHAAELYASAGDAGWAAQSRGGVLRDLADARLLAGKVAQARGPAQEALALAERFQRTPAIASSQWMLALIAIQENKPDEAMTRAKAALAGSETTGDATMLWNAWYAVARAHELKNQSSEAVDAYEKALENLGRSLLATGGESDQQGYMNSGRVREVYKGAIDRFLKAGRTSRAMEVLELSRDAALKSSFDATKVKTKDAKLRARLDKYDDARARVQGLQKQLDTAMSKPAEQRSEAQVRALGEQIAKTRQELNQVVLDLKVTHRHLFQALAMDPQNLVGRRQDLPAGSVVVEYFVADDALYAFVIAAALAQPAVVRVKLTSAELESTIADFRTAIIKEPERVEALGRKLDDWLLQPLRPHLDGVSTVILLPFGPLYYVPFDALVVSEPGQPVRYAVEDFRIAVQTATTLEHLLRSRRPRVTGTMLAISNPDGSLPSAAKEVNRIVKTALPDAQVLGNRQATVKKFEDVAGGFRYLHLATHSVLDVDPRKSYLKLSDGPLTVEQISRLQGLEQGNELVVLSACETAVEKGASTGDELVSVAVAFSMAGSPALVASLWEVGDESTAELMATFYRALEQGTGDRLDALRNAKLNLLRLQRGKDRPYASPWHWASFQLYGDFRAPAAQVQ